MPLYKTMKDAPKTERFEMRLSLDDAAFLDTLAASLGLDRANTVRMVVRDACRQRQLELRRRKTLPPTGKR